MGLEGYSPSHIGVFGNTGSGKSNTLAKIYSELFETLKKSKEFKENSKFVLIDFNGEYGENSITEDKTIYRLTTGNNEGQKYPIRKDQIEKIEILSILLEATEKTQKPFLRRVIKDTYFRKNFEERAKDNIEDLVIDILREPVNRLNILHEFFFYLKNMDISGNAEKIFNRLDNFQLQYHSRYNAYYYEYYGQHIYANSDLNALYEKIFKEVSFINY